MTRLLSLDELDTACQAQWREGAVDACRLLAAQLRQRAREVDDTGLEARAWLHTARCDLRSANYLSALEAALQAAECARLEGLTEPEVEAHALGCTALTALRRLDEAIAAGALALELARQEPHSLALVMAADPLGLALAWSGQADAADQVFAAGIACALDLGRADWAAHLAIHRACGHALALVLTRDDEPATARAPRLARIGQVLEDALARCERSPGVPNSVTQRPGRFLLGWVQVLCACWEGDLDGAQRLLTRIRPLVRRDRGWHDLLAQCAAAEIARTQGQLDAAQAQVREVMAEAQALSHLALADLAAGLLSRVLAEQGQPAQALAVERERARQRRQALAAHTAQQQRSAATTAEWRSRGQSAAAAALRPSDDPLTGLADRRQFTQRLDGLLQRTDVERARCAVMLVGLAEADGLAARHGPLLRDRVLCALAGLLRQSLRSGDLPARWTQDEFSVLLHRSGQEECQRIAERITDAVARHAWSALAPGLQVRLHIGQAPARSGDTVSQLMRRCDDALHASARQLRRVA
jgi:diguanylate cyclase (GGDEF)-like protein